MTTLPPISAALVEALDALYPERSAELSWSDREVWAKAGERNVVRFLKRRLEDQQDSLLTASIVPASFVSTKASAP